LYTDAKLLKHSSIGDTHINEKNTHCDWSTKGVRADLVDEHLKLCNMLKKAYAVTCSVA